MLKKIKQYIYRKSLQLGNRFGVDLPYYLKNGFWTFLWQLASILSGIFLSIIFARFTSTEVYGQYNLIFSIVSILSILSIPGFNNSIIRSVSRGYEGAYSKVFRLSLLWSLIAVPFLIFIGFYYYYYENQALGISLIVASLLFPFFYSPKVWIPFLHGKSMFFHRSIFLVIQLLITSTCITLAVFLGEGSLIPVFITNMLSNAVLNVSFYLICKRYVENDKDDKTWKKSGYKLTVIPFGYNIYNYLDKLLIGILLGDVQLAIYSIATAISSRLVSEQRQLLNLIQPRLYQRKDITSSLKQIPRLLLLAIAFAGVISLILPFLMTLLYGEKYAESIPYAQFYMLCFPIASINIVFSIILVGQSKENQIIKTTIISFAVNMILYLVLIPLWGIYGAIISSICFYLCSASLMYYFIWQKKE